MFNSTLILAAGVGFIVALFVVFVMGAFYVLLHETRRLSTATSNLRSDLISLQCDLKSETKGRKSEEDKTRQWIEREVYIIKAKFWPQEDATSPELSTR